MVQRRKWLGLAAAVALGLSLVSAADADGFRRYFRLRRDLAALEQRRDRFASENARLAREIEALRKDPAAQERAAREELGYVKPGEVVINLEAQ